MARAVPDDVEFATKPVLAQRINASALDAGLPAPWVAGDEVYGADSGLRSACRHRGIEYVLAVARNHYVVTADRRVDVLAPAMPAFGWQQLSAGAGSKGARLYSWLLSNIAANLPDYEWIMVRRNDSTQELAYYRCWSPHPVPQPGGAGPSRNPSRAPRAKPDSMGTKYAPGPPGAAG